jgi:flagellar basal body rod protein FlgB
MKNWSSDNGQEITENKGRLPDVSSLAGAASDGITELLLKIIEFTQIRQKILIQNVNSIQTPGFVPRDLPVAEFSNLINIAISEYSTSQRLVLCDGQNVKFGQAGCFETAVLVDQDAQKLLEEDRDEYLRAQINKMLENTLNQKIALELLKQKQSGECRLGRCFN